MWNEIKAALNYALEEKKAGKPEKLSLSEFLAV